jgi:hypothetical protein
MLGNQARVVLRTLLPPPAQTSVSENLAGSGFEDNRLLAAAARFGFFLVRSGEGTVGRYPSSVLLHFGTSCRNPCWRLERLLRD